MALTLTEILALVGLAAALAGLVAALLYVRKTSSDEAEVEPVEAAPLAETATVVAGRRGGARRRRGGLARLAAAAARDEGGAAAGPSEGGGGRVKKKKEANREARREAREAHLARLEELREREAREEEERKERDEEDEMIEEEREERERAAREEKEKKEQEEYEEWKDLISVEDAGEQADVVGQEDPEMLTRFCQYVKDAKIVVLEELAAEFSLKTEEVIDRLTKLEETGTLPGFFDDRGKFIYVSVEEMEAVAQFIKKKGRVSILELAAESTRLLNLDAATAA